MRYREKIVLTWPEILSGVTAGIFLLDVPYLAHIANMRPFKMAMLAVVMICGLICLHNQKITVRNEYIVLLSGAAYVLLITVLCRGSVAAYVKDFGSVVSICFLILVCRRKTEMIRCMKILCLVFLLLTLADLISMVVWPDGMYAGTFVRNNWFLGYKTVRLNYTFSLLMLYAYMELLEKRTLTLRFLWLSILVSVDAVLSNGSGAAAAVTVFSLTMLLAFFHADRRTDSSLREAAMRILNMPAAVMTIWTGIFLAVVFGSDTPVIRSVIQRLGKDFSYGERVTAWTRILSAIRGHWLMGIGMQGRNRLMLLTGGFSNAHNTLFTYWLTGGLIGALLLMAVFAAALSRTSSHPANYAMTTFIYCVLFLGITSSALAFSPFLFAALMLAMKEYDEDGPAVQPAICRYFRRKC